MDPEDPAAGANVDDPSDSSKIKSKGLQHVFNQARDLFPKFPVPYYEDGDPEMYTPENIAKRKALKNNDLVKEAIEDFKKEFDLGPKGNCSKETYFKVFTNIAFILKPGFEADELQ